MKRLNRICHTKYISIDWSRVVGSVQVVHHFESGSPNHNGSLSEGLEHCLLLLVEATQHKQFVGHL